MESHTIDVDGVRMHYVRSGSGPTMVLLHGFPQDWYEWRDVMARLDSTYTTVAVDLRGVGGSDAPDDGYDAATLAADVHGLVERLGLGPVHVAGHDIGGWVAYAYARSFLPGADAYSSEIANRDTLATRNRIRESDKFEFHNTTIVTTPDADVVEQAKQQAFAARGSRVPVPHGAIR